MKKTRYLALTLSACLAGSVLLPFAADAAVQPEITLSDLVVVARYISGTGELTPEQRENFDLTGDGEVTLSDLVRLARLYTQEQETPGPSVPVPTASPSAAATSTALPPQQTISEQEAYVIALNEVPGATEQNIVSSKQDYNDDAFSRVYEIEISYEGVQYEFEITTTGVIWKKSMERPVTPDFTGSQQTAQSARELVLARVPGATQEDFVAFKQDTEHGIPVFEGELRYKGTEYDFEIVVATGEIIFWSEEKYQQAVPEPTASAGPTATSAPTSAILTEQQAIDYALLLVPGSSRSDIVSCKQEFSDSAMASVFDIELRYGGAKYEFEITTSGTVWKQSMERPVTPGFAGTQQTEQSVQELVLSRVPGASSTDFTQLKSDTEDGLPVYEGELRYNGTEYEFTVAANTGEFLSWSEEKYYMPVPMPTFRPSSDPAPTPSPSPGASASSLISRDEAIRIALGHIPGATAANVVKCRLDTSHGLQVFEIEVRYGGHEYELEIDASSGAVLEFKEDRG